jgi:uncharacterized protein YraI
MEQGGKTVNRNLRIAAALMAVFMLALLLISGQAHATDSLPSNTATWTARYWNNTDMSGTNVLRQGEYGLTHDWGNGSPQPGVNADNFSARWDTNLDFTAGNHRFTAVSDDGVRVYVDGTLVIDNWTYHTATTNRGTINLSAGNHTVRVEYFEGGGGAIIAVGWENLTNPTPGPQPINNWRGEYFNNINHSGTPTLVRDDAAINFDWGTGSPGSGIGADDFSVRWTRALSLEAGTYRFNMTVDDGGRLYINNSVVIDKYFNQTATTYSYDYVHGGGTVNVRMDYYDDIHNAVARLTWDRIIIVTPTPQPGGGQVLEARTPLNVREGPGTTYRVMGVIYPGTKYAVVGKSGDWVLINFGGRTGYVYGPLATITGGTVNTPPPGQGVEAVTTLNVRTGPGVGFAIIGKIRPGTIYRVTGQQAGWYQIDFNGQPGWVSGAFVSVR